MKDTILFISDIHFGLLTKEKEKSREKLFVNFLEFAATEAKELYILGDLFDYWFEYRRVIQKGFFRALTAMQDLAESGVKIHYIIGNHDFLHRDFFEKEIGVTLYQDPFSIEINNKKFFLGHGDGLVKNDLGYKILKKILRSKISQTIYSILHPDFGIWLASSTSKSSRDYTGKKNYGEVDGLFEAAKEKIDDGFDYVLFGHSHIRKFENYKNGYYINLGTWLEQACYGKFDGNKFEIIDWN